MNKNIIEIEWKELFKPIKGLKVDQINEISIKREVIPIIFVPGIMGSRLQTDDGQKVWDPDDITWMFLKYGIYWADAKKKKEALVGYKFRNWYLEVYDKKVSKRLLEFPGSKERGWGGVSWNFYGEFLGALQKRLWSEPIRHCFDMPVHAFAYNWTSSCDLQGQNLSSYISAVKKQYPKCKKVILVTHSMGGLVARSACILHGAKDNVLGVIHGVQPSSGVATAYWRMKSGFERPLAQPDKTVMDYLRNPLKVGLNKPKSTATSWVLGSHGEEVTALLGNMPGGLQLLPSQSYTDNDGNSKWIRFKDADLETYVMLPESNIYKEVYEEKEKFYGLVNPDWLDPGGMTDSFELTPWDNYEIYLKEAKSFHDKLGLNLHPETYQFHSTDLNTTDRIIFEREVHSWSNKAKRLGKILKDKWSLKRVSWEAVKAAIFDSNIPTKIAKEAIWTIVKDTDEYVRRGGYRVYVDENDNVIQRASEDKLAIIYLLTLKEPLIDDKLKNESWKGDGTVSVSSGKALSAKTKKASKAEATIAIGKDNEPWWERSHDNIFLTKSAQNITFAAIENFCLQKIEETLG